MRTHNVIIENFKRTSAVLTEELRGEFEHFWDETEENEGKRIILNSFCPKVSNLTICNASLIFLSFQDHFDRIFGFQSGNKHVIAIDFKSKFI